MSQLSDPYSPVVYFLHTVIGTLGVLFGLLALARRKGSVGHKRAGWGFVVGGVIAAVTAILFSGTEPSPLAIASALLVLGLVWTAVLALRPDSGGVRAWNRAATGLLVLGWLILTLLGGFGVALVLGLLPPPPGVAVPPPSVVLLPLGYALFPTWFLIDDLRLRRSSPETRRARAFGRHVSRMAFALAIAVHAPVVSFADDLGLNPLLAFFGPFLIWPLVLVSVRRHPILRPTIEAGAA